MDFTSILGKIVLSLLKSWILKCEDLFFLLVHTLTMAEKANSCKLLPTMLGPSCAKKTFLFLQNETVINLHRNIKSETYFLDCGPQTRDECAQGIHQCPDTSVCHDLYHGYSCSCMDEDKKLDQYQNCASLKNCDLSHQGTSTVILR